MDNSTSASVPSQDHYALSGKIMLCSVIVLFVVIILMLCLHIYVRWHLIRRRRRSLQPNRGRTSALESTPFSRRGLEPEVLKSIPVFVFSSGKAEAPQMDCAVCLCEFQEEEKGRILPNCKHRFHVECIDMWFFSHTTCPLCRSSVVLKLPETTQLRVDDLCDSCRHDEEMVNSAAPSSSSSSSSSSSLQSGTEEGGEIRIEIPATKVEEELKSPGGGRLLFRRMLSFNCGGLSIGGNDLERAEMVDENDPRRT